ncbi:alpha-ketoglutarate-dependent sulfonate dioxygenase, partial [Zopfochytrium polystomum]
RGAPENAGDSLQAVHPLIRTNPVTGWKGVYAVRGFTRQINELSKDESDAVLQYLFRLNAENHDLQVRFKWSKNDAAIWDNRSSVHSATSDYGEELRVGDRVVSLGERPYFDPASKSHREDLRIPTIRELRYGAAAQRKESR